MYLFLGGHCLWSVPLEATGSSLLLWRLLPWACSGEGLWLGSAPSEVTPLYLLLRRSLHRAFSGKGCWLRPAVLDLLPQRISPEHFATKQEGFQNVWAGLNKDAQCIYVLMILASRSRPAKEAKRGPIWMMMIGFKPSVLSSKKPRYTIFLS